MEDTTYSVHIYCSNCDYRTTHPKEMVEIPKGTTFVHWKIHNECPKCGCRTLEQY